MSEIEIKQRVGLSQEVGTETPVDKSIREWTEMDAAAELDTIIRYLGNVRSEVRAIEDSVKRLTEIVKERAESSDRVHH